MKNKKMIKDNEKSVLESKYLLSIKRRKFSLIELLVAISIIAILAGMVIGGLSAVSQKSNLADTKATIFKLQDVFDKYKEQNGKYPLDTTTILKFDSGSNYLDQDDYLIFLQFGDVGGTDSDGDGSIDGILDGWGWPLVVIFSDSYNTATVSVDTTETGNAKALDYTINGTTTTAKYNPNSFQIISAGEDEIFGTADDIGNFTKVD